MGWDDEVVQFPAEKEGKCPVCTTGLVWEGTSDCAPALGCPKCRKGVEILKRMVPHIEAFKDKECDGCTQDNNECQACVGHNRYHNRLIP